MLDSATVVKKSANQVSCVLNEEAAVLNLDRALYFGLSGVAAHIWDALQEPRSVAEICDGVMMQFDVASEVCRADVASFVISMRDAGLVEIVG
jgi:Coenzyme PQQ synthesis protein D (PqqD)